jgi:predicted CopG family antitoxin
MFKCMHMHGYSEMGTTTISLNDEAYKVLKAQKKEGESFSELILRKFGKGSPAAIKAVVMELGPDPESADAMEKASRELRKNFKTRKVEL